MNAGDSEPPLPDGAVRREGLRNAVTRVARALVSLLSTRVELASIELAEERDRITKQLAFAAAGGMLIAFGALFVGAFVIVLFWDTHRLWAIAAVAAVHLVAGLALLSKAKGIRRDAPSPFAATIDELKKDKELLERALAPREQ